MTTRSATIRYNKSFWFYIKFNLINFRDAIFRYVTDVIKIISGLLTSLQ